MNKKVIIAGAGLMGASLAQLYAEAGYDTVVWCHSASSAGRCQKLIDLNQPTMVRTGMLTQEASDALKKRISYVQSMDCFRDPDVDLILETIVEDLAIKQDFLRDVSKLANDHCLLATNTSGLHISDIAAKMDHKDRFIGQHWLNPPHLIPVCELVIGKDTSAETVAQMKALVTDLGKHPVCVKDIQGFLVNRLQYALLREALHIVDSGAATVEDVDDVLRYGLGIRMAALGQFRVCDFGGVDIYDRISHYLFADLDNSTDNPHMDKLVREGKCGVKAGAGFYDYSGDKAEQAIKERDELYIKLVKCLFK